MPSDRRIGEISEVSRSGVELCLDWKISQFLDLSNGECNHYVSPCFRFYDARWHLEVYPDCKPSGRVDLCLRRDDNDNDTDSTRTVKVSVGFRGSDGGVERRRETERAISKNVSLFLGALCTRSELTKQEPRLMPGNVLTIACEMKVPGSTAVEEQSSNECDICCEAPIDCALNPCGHMSWCYNCALRFWEDDIPRCPMCRKPIQNILKIYR